MISVTWKGWLLSPGVSSPRPWIIPSTSHRKRVSPWHSPSQGGLMYACLQRMDLERHAHERCAHHSRHSISLLLPWLSPACYLCGSKSTKGISLSAEPVHKLVHWGFIECKVWCGDMSQEDVGYHLNLNRRRRFFTTGMWRQEFCWCGEKRVEEKNSRSLWISAAPALVPFEDWQFTPSETHVPFWGTSEYRSQSLLLFLYSEGPAIYDRLHFFLWKHRDPGPKSSTS